MFLEKVGTGLKRGNFLGGFHFTVTPEAAAKTTPLTMWLSVARIMLMQFT